MDRVYIAIDLKSFYASVECVEQNLDPLDAHLVVADESRTEKTICLAVSPPLKSYGVSGRARLFEVIQRVEDINRERAWKAPRGKLTGKSHIQSELLRDPSLALDFVIARPRMARYMKVSAQIYGIYLRYVAPEDIFAYSIDEVFIDATGYLRAYGMDAHGFARMLVQEVLAETGITATAGIGTNLYLCKVAMDIVAKHMAADKDGVRIAALDEASYKALLWSHTPLTDFWRIGRGTEARLQGMGIFTMGDVAELTLNRSNIALLYRAFGKNAELLIDHAWGIEPTTIADVKAYRPRSSSLSSGQVLTEPCGYARTRLIAWEMADMLSLDLVSKRLVTDQLVLTIGYDRMSLADGSYTGPVTVDHYGRQVPRHAHGTQHLSKHTASTRKITEALMLLFDRIFDPSLLARRITIAACNVICEADIPEGERCEQLSLFDTEETIQARAEDEKSLERERSLQEAMLRIKHRFGKNAVLKGTNYIDGATAKDRNQQIGGHAAGEPPLASYSGG